MTFKEPLSRLPAEWEPQDGVLIALPHAGTDWAPMLAEVTDCYTRLIVAMEADATERVIAADVPTNDTWTRDYGPITIETDEGPRLLDFKFNAWGMKFAACLDNQVTAAMNAHGHFIAPVESHQDMVLEGGAIESDGCGTIMTTSRCLLEPNRNGAWDKARIESELKRRLGAQQVLWLDHGGLPGDDTDGHIDTLARFAPGGVILHVASCDDGGTYPELELMIEQLRTFTTAQGQPYRLVELPLPHRICDDDGEQLPATYANFLIMNTQVLVPTYGQPDLDRRALDIVASVFTDRRVVGVDCQALIKQHGSLHCATMQFPRGTLKITD